MKFFKRESNYYRDIAMIKLSLSLIMAGDRKDLNIQIYIYIYIYPNYNVTAESWHNLRLNFAKKT
jgi:hypothetical protein